MDDAMLRNVQLIQLEIAKEVKRICEQNNISYFMDGGTLLGAVRHKGFIPWDDDLDFGFTRDNYEKFIATAKKNLSSEFFLQTWDSDREYGYAFAKIRKKGTIYQERIAQDSDANCGIFIDLFPYDNLPNDKNKRRKLITKLTFLKMLLKTKVNYKPWMENETINWKRWMNYLPVRFVSQFVSKDRIQKHYMKIVKVANTEKSELIYLQVAEKLGVWAMKKEYFSKYISLKFEDTFFPAPVGYKEFLTDGYGDYMTPPPIEKRKNIHGIIKIDLGNK